MKFIHREIEFNLKSQNRIIFFEENDLKNWSSKKHSRIMGQ